MKSEITLLKDSEWAKIEEEVCRVIDFNPLAVIKNGRIRRVGVMPYASITLECEKVSEKISGFINYREDFQHLWTAFKERGIKDNEEVLIIWSRNHYTFKWLRIFSFLLPKLRVMVCPRGAYELITNDKWKPELTGEARAKASLPIVDLKSKVME
jgi:hypothetical protein